MASGARGKFHPGSAALPGTLLGPTWFLLPLSCDLQNGPIKHWISHSCLHPSIQVVTKPCSIPLPKCLSNYLMPHTTCALGPLPSMKLVSCIKRTMRTAPKESFYPHAPLLSIHRPHLPNNDLSKSQIQSGLSLQSSLVSHCLRKTRSLILHTK